MKTTELIKKVNREIKNIKTVLEEEHICFYEYDQEKPFYKYPTWGKTRGCGMANFAYLNGDTVDSIYMLHIFKLLDLLDEYIATNLEDRKEEKKYYVLVPTIKNNLYMFRYTNEDIGFFLYKTEEDLKKSRHNQFTEEEIKKIDERYWNFAEEVK